MEEILDFCDAINAAMVMAMVCIKREVNIVGTELITSEENWLCDGQSR